MVLGYPIAKINAVSKISILLHVCMGHVFSSLSSYFL